MLRGKNIVLGVTGGIAAYKAAIIIRLLIKGGANVKVIMTPSAKHFITPLTLSTLSKNPIFVDSHNPENGSWNSHVDLGQWGDVMLIAPATANTIAKMAAGIADNLLLTTYLSVNSQVFIAPAMDFEMFKHHSTNANIETLTNRGVNIIDADVGELASGLKGKGRMAEPDDIVARLSEFFSKKKLQTLKGKKVLVNAGPTHEAIDPVRYISNYSSGKMGVAIVDEAALRGAEVTLVLGPSICLPQNSRVNVIKVNSAAEMSNKCIEHFVNSDISILCAAVSDFTPVSFSDKKLKNKNKNPSLQLTNTLDIAANLGSKKKDDQIIVGFALETDNDVKSAQQKLKNKNFDFIVLNSLNDKGAGFGTNTNKVTIIDKNNIIDIFELKSKSKVAKDIIDKLETMLK